MKTNILSLLYALFVIVVCLTSCDTPETTCNSSETNELEIIKVDAVVIKKVYRPEYVSNKVEFDNDSSISCFAQKYYPEEYELYAVDNKGEVYTFTEKNLSPEVFHKMKLKDTGVVSRAIEERDKILYDTTIVDFDCVVTEKYYLPERIEIDTHQVKTKDNFERDEIVEILHQEKSFVKGIRLDNNDTTEVVIESYERVSNIRMNDTIACYRVELHKRHKK